jgi:hypothetical protein
MAQVHPTQQSEAHSTRNTFRDSIIVGLVDWNAEEKSCGEDGRDGGAGVIQRGMRENPALALDLVTLTMTGSPISGNRESGSMSRSRGDAYDSHPPRQYRRTVDRNARVPQGSIL